MYKKFYDRQFKLLLNSSLNNSDGLDSHTIENLLKNQGLFLPKALVEYYEIAGQHWINHKHNQLRSIEKLEWMDDRLIFMEENQSVAFWGFSNMT